MLSLKWFTAALLLWSAGPANAASWLREEFIGSVTSVTNPSGFLANTKVGNRFTAIYYFNLANGTIVNDGSHTEVSGGLVAAEAFIGQWDIPIFGNYAAVTGVYSLASYSNASAQTSGNPSTMLSTSITAATGVIPPTFAVGSYFGSGTGNYIEGTESIGANLFIVDFSYIALVPEPETWVMMLFGFGGIGFLLRNRRRVGDQLHSELQQ